MAREIKIEGRDELFCDKVKKNNAQITKSHTDPDEYEDDTTYKKPGDVAYKPLKAGQKVNGVEIKTSLTDIDEYEDDTEEESKPSSILKEYQKDVVENDIKKRLSKNVLTKEEEEALKEKFVQEKTDEITNLYKKVIKANKFQKKQ